MALRPQARPASNRRKAALSESESVMSFRVRILTPATQAQNDTFVVHYSLKKAAAIGSSQKIIFCGSWSDGRSTAG